MSQSPLIDGVVRLASPSGATLGTAFVIGPHLVLTCHHVVANVREVIIEGTAGTEKHGVPIIDDALAAFDLALVDCPTIVGRPMPIVAASEAPAAYLSRGYHFGGAGFTSALPLSGSIGGDTSMTYRSYNIDAWTLGGATFGPGMSGAPIVERDTGVVVGVISARVPGLETALAGTGIPLHHAAAANAALANAIAANDITLPRFGQYLNALGAQWILDRHAASIVASYEDRGVFLPDRVVPRAAVAALLDEFLISDRSIAPIIGVSGSGKSTFVADLARSHRTPVLVIPALSIESPNDAFETYIERIIASVELPEKWRPSAALFLDVLRESGTPPVIVVDGLNEARINVGDVADAWLPAITSRARRLGLKLIVTCRSEYWTRVHSSFNAKLIREGGDIRLGDFSDDELAQAASSYGLTLDDASSTSIFRHPLMLRIASELTASENAPATLLRSQAIARYLDRASNSIANRTSGAPVASAVRRTIARLAQALDSRSLVVDRAQFDTIAQPPPDLAWAFLKENLLYESDGVVRFTFDEVAEFLIAEAVGLSSLNAAIRTLDQPNQTISVSVIVQMLRRGHEERDPQLAGAVAALAAASTIDSWDAPLALREFFQSVPDATAFVPALATVVDNAMVGEDDTMMRSFTWDMIGFARVDAGVSLGLARALAPTEDGSGLRDGDRSRPSMVGDLGETVKQIIERVGPDALDGLAQWLDDETSLAGGEGTVGSAGAMMLANFSASWRPSTIDAIARANNSRARDLLAAHFDGRPQALATKCDAWMSDERYHPRFIFLCISAIARMDVDSAVRLYRQLRGTTYDSELRLSIDEQLLHHGAAEDDVVDALVEAFAAGGVSLGAVTSIIASHWDAIRGAIHTRLQRFPAARDDISVISALGRNSFAPDIERSVAALLRELYDTNAVGASILAQTIESKLYAIDPALAESIGLVDLSIQIAREGALDARQCITYVAYSSIRAPEREVMARRLRAALIESAADSDQIARLLKTALQSVAPDDEQRAALDALVPRMSVHERDNQAFSLLLSTRGESRVLNAWVSEHESDLGPRAGMVVRRLAAGEDPWSAIKGTMAEFARRRGNP